MMRATGIVTGYGNAQILNGISLSVAPGEALAIVGANGAGKSTLVGALVGSRKLWKGSVELDGQDLSGLPADARVEAGVVLCPEGRRILASLTVEENLVLGGTVTERGPQGSRRESRNDLEEVYERFPILHERRASPGGTLSGGQQQLLAIGRALMARPKVLLLDEPSLGLAPQVIATVYERLRDLRSEGRAIVLVEEGARRALAFADRGIVMVNGSVVLEGSVDELAAHPELESAYLGTATAEDPAYRPAGRP
jgi:branched-chain amino acid transport system ATP-binding protein